MRCRPGNGFMAIWLIILALWHVGVDSLNPVRQPTRIHTTFEMPSADGGDAGHIANLVHQERHTDPGCADPHRTVLRGKRQ